MSERPVTLDHLRSKKKPHRQSITLALDPEIAEQFEEAQNNVRTARIRAEGKGYEPEVQSKIQEDLAAAEARLEELRPLMEEASIEFVFQSIGRKKYENLTLAHPPTSEQITRAKEYSTEEDVRKGEDRLMYNPDSFPVALISACLASPKMSESEVREMWESDDWTGTELMTLFFTAQAVNVRRAQVNLGKG